MFNPVTAAVVLILLQTQQPSSDRLELSGEARDIITLRDERARLEGREEALQKRLAEAERTLPVRRERDAAEAALRQAKPEDPNYGALREKFDFYQRNWRWNDSNTTQALNDLIARTNEEIAQNDEDLRTNERDMYRATLVEHARQKFMNIVSGIFGFLMLVIIVGFFVPVWRHPTLGHSLFNGPPGLQMITLLSVVIAIILFGITGILEGKELSALLGSLIGFILGRTSQNGNSSQSDGAGKKPDGNGDKSDDNREQPDVTLEQSNGNRDQ